MLRSAILLAFCLACDLHALPDPRKRGVGDKRLQFTSNGTFHLTVFEDLHYGEGTASTVFHGMERDIDPD